MNKRNTKKVIKFVESQRQIDNRIEESYESHCYEDLSRKALMNMLKSYHYYKERAKRGNMGAMSIKIDIDNAIDFCKAENFTSDEYVCIIDCLINDRSIQEVSKKINKTERMVRYNIVSGTKKIKSCMQNGGGKNNNKR